MFYDIDGSWNLWIYAKGGSSLSSSPSTWSCTSTGMGCLDNNKENKISK